MTGHSFGHSESLPEICEKGRCCNETSKLSNRDAHSNNNKDGGDRSDKYQRIHICKIKEFEKFAKKIPKIVRYLRKEWFSKY